MKEKYGLIMVLQDDSLDKSSDKICTYDKAFDSKEEAEKVAIREANKIRFLDKELNKCHIYSTRTGIAIAEEDKPYRCIIHIVGFACNDGENKIFTIKDDLTEEEFDNFLKVLTNFEGDKPIRKRVSCEVI